MIKGLLRVADDAQLQRIHEGALAVLERTGLGPRGQVLGKFTSAGVPPSVLDHLRTYGIHLPDSIFKEEQELKGR